MASQITDPRDFTQHINEKMLGDFLGIQEPPIPFEVKGEKAARQKRVSEDAVTRFIQAIKNLKDKNKADWLFSEMLYINELSSEKHRQGLENQAAEDHVAYDLDDYGKCECHDERALWWYIHHKNIFDKYFERADTENLAGLRELMIPKEYAVTKERVADSGKLAAFGQGVAKIYENTLRGKKFKVANFLEEHCILIRVYLENLPNTELVFMDDKNTVGRAPSNRSLFSIIVLYDPDEKILGIRTTQPAENVPKLADLFCRTFLNCTGEDTTERKFNVENQRSVAMLELTPEPGGDIEQCYLKAVEYGKAGDYTKTLRLDVGGRNYYTGTEAMEAFIKQSGIKEGEWQTRKFQIKFIFKKADEKKGRKRQITATLTKKGVNLKNTPEDQKIRQFLKAKGFIS